MRLPRLRLPRPSLDWIGALGGRTTLLYIGYTTLLFVVFLIVTFPHDLLIRRALSSVNQGPVAVQFNTAAFAWFKGYELTGLRIAPAEADGHPPYLECSHLWVRPALGALVRGNPYAIQMSADLYGGTALGEARLADGNLVGNLQWQGIDVARYRTLTALLDEGQLSGKISGQFEFEARGDNLTVGQGNGEVSVEGIGLVEAKIGGFSVPELHFRQTKLKFGIRSGRLEVQDLNATGDLNVQGSGQIVLREPAQDSVLNLRGTLLPTATTPDALKAVLALIPRAPGAKPDAPMTVTGTLAHPRVR
jgi:type II secretion system protein N